MIGFVFFLVLLEIEIWVISAAINFPSLVRCAKMSTKKSASVENFLDVATKTYEDKAAINTTDPKQLK